MIIIELSDDDKIIIVLLFYKERISQATFVFLWGHNFG